MKTPADIAANAIARATLTAAADRALDDLQGQALKLHAALVRIADLPPGSQGGYTKFAQAQRIAKEALGRS